MKPRWQQPKKLRHLKGDTTRGAPCNELVDTVVSPSAERGNSTAGSKTASDSWKAGKMGKEKEMQVSREHWIFYY